MRQMFFLVLFAGITYLLVQLLFPRRRAPRKTGPQASTSIAEEMVRDPECQVYLPRSDAIRRKVQGREYFFCSPGCLDKFLARHS